MWIEYAFLVSFFTVLIVAAFIRIRHPFWSMQPVFHTYDVWRYLITQPSVIQTSALYQHTKFLRHDKVTTKSFLDFTEKEMDDLVDVLQCHHVPSERVTFTLTKDHLYVLGAHHMTAPCWVSTLGKTGILLAYPVRVVFSGIQEIVFYWEFVTMHRESPVENTRTLVQTHEANQRRHNPDMMPVSLFRQDVALCDGVVPLVQFSVNRFEIKKVIQKPPLPMEQQVIRVDGNNIHILMDVLWQSKTRFDVLIFPEMTSMQARIDANEWYVFTLQEKDVVLALYIFRNPHLTYEDSGEGVECLASMSVLQDNPTFFAGWLHALCEISVICPIDWVSLTNLGHNAQLLQTWTWKYPHPLSRHDAAYYFYNYVCPAKQPEQCWIVL